MSLFKKFKSLTLASKFIILIGVIIMVVGVVFLIYNLNSSGVTMGEAGEPYGKATIDGKGILFCGIVIIVFGLFIFQNKKHS